MKLSLIFENTIRNRSYFLWALKSTTKTWSPSSQQPVKLIEVRLLWCLAMYSILGLDTQWQSFRINRLSWRHCTASGCKQWAVKEWQSDKSTVTKFLWRLNMDLRQSLVRNLAPDTTKWRRFSPKDVHIWKEKKSLSFSLLLCKLQRTNEAINSWKRQ